MLVKKFVKFIFVGIVNTLFGYCVFASLIYLNLHYALAVFLASLIGALFNFKTIGGLVFKSSDNALLFRFLGVYAVTYLLNVAALRAFSMCHVSMYLAGILLALPMALVAFALQSRFVFRGSGIDRFATVTPSDTIDQEEQDLLQRNR